MAAQNEALHALTKVVRERFPRADGIRYGHTTEAGGDTILWQVLAGNRAIWSASPAVIKTQIPAWERLGEAVMLMAQAIPPDVEGDWLVLRLS